MQQELPEFAKLLGQIEEQHPGAVRRGFSRIAPRLRHLRRIHEQNPELARLVETHAVNKYRVEMLRRSWQRAKDARRQQVEQRMRDCVAAIVHAEQRTLEIWTEELAAGREQRIADRLASLTQGDPDLARESPGVRQRVEEFASAVDDARRQEVESELAAILEQQFDHRLAALRRRVEELRDNAPEEVDRRMEHLLKAPRSRRSRP